MLKTTRHSRPQIISDYCAETAVARELVLRLASLLWRLRRATAIETDLLEIQAEALRERRLGVLPDRRLGPYDDVVRAFAGAIRADAFVHARDGTRPGFGERIVRSINLTASTTSQMTLAAQRAS